jgi:hypothetical protein
LQAAMLYVGCTVPCPPLQVAAQEPASILSLLQQLTHPSIPNFCIINCEAWQPLLLLLPHLLTSTSTDTAAAAHKLLLQQLAPELLDCNPEPLAQLLVALLAAASSSHLATAAAAEPNNNTSVSPAVGAAAFSSHPATTGAAEAAAERNSNTSVSPAADAAAAAGSSCTWSSSVVQLLVVGLSKLLRQWHFLEAELALQLCSALVDALLQPLASLLQSQQQGQQPLALRQQQQPQQQQQQQGQQLLTMSPQQQQQQGQQPLVAMVPQQQQGQQQQQQASGEVKHATCCLAEQLLLADPSMGWWHRLNANAKSCRVLRRVAIDKGLAQALLLLHVQRAGQQTCRPQQAGEEESQAVTAEGVAADHTPQTTSSSIKSSVTLADCLVVQLLSGFVANLAGRPVLLQAAAAQQSSCAGQHYVTTAKQPDQQQQQQQTTPAMTGSTVEPAVGWDVLAEAFSCLQSMADACTAASTSCGDLVAAAAAAEARRALAALNNAAGA